MLMKKQLTLLFVLAAAMQAMAYDFQATMADGRTLYFNVLSSTECEVSRMYYTERNASYVSGALVIPASVTDAEGNRYTVTAIGKSAFVHCRSLTSVTVPVTVTSIGNAAFQKCRSLTTVTLPDGIQTIGDEAFEECTSLADLTLPRSVKRIGIEAFEGCEAMKTLYVNSLEPPMVAASTFPLDANNKVPFTLYVPYGTYAAYRNAGYWYSFADIRETGAQPQPSPAYGNASAYGNTPANGNAGQPAYTGQQPASAYPAQQSAAYPAQLQGSAYPVQQQPAYTNQQPASRADELDDLQRQVIDLQQRNARLKDALYRALLSASYEDCRRILHDALAE